MEREYELGEIVARQEAQAKSLDELKSQVAKLEAEVHAVKLLLAEIRGALRFAMAASAFIGAIAGLAIKWFAHEVTK